MKEHSDRPLAEIFQTLEYGPAPESAALAHEWLDSHGREFGLFIGGEWVPAAGGSFESMNPASGKPLARIGNGSKEDVDRAVAAARVAFESWSRAPGHVRARWLYALAREVQKHSRLFAVLESLDNGKPIRESRDIDIPLVARHFYHHAGWAQLMESELPGYVPVGVVGQIIPWNFPLLMLAWKVAPALAMGNTVVLKPAGFTPLTALLFADVVRQAGLPPGVFNVVTGGGRSTGMALVEHPDVDKIAFTGSTEVGRTLRTATAGSGKKLSLELGGKSPFVVFDDADLDSVVEGVVDAIWFNQGQVCCAGSRILAQEGIAAELERKLKARMETLRVGDPLDKTTDIGAIVAPVQLETIKGYCEKGVAEGASCWQPTSWSPPAEGSFFPPTLFTDVAPAATIAQEEIFGPVVVMMTFRTPAEAVGLANNTRYGLAASVWSESVNLALDVAPMLKAGTVWVNCTNVFDAASGFGGYRESGYGREGGREGLWEYVRPAWERPIGQALTTAGERAGRRDGVTTAEGETAGRRDGATAEGETAGRRDGVTAEGETAGRRDGGLAVEGGSRSSGATAASDAPAIAEKPAAADAPLAVPPSRSLAVSSSPAIGLPAPKRNGGARIDRTPKLYIGGKQARPDSGYSLAVVGPDGAILGEVGLGNRKDVRNAVEAAHKAEGWGRGTAHARAQILYYVAENLAAREAEFAERIHALTGAAPADAEREVRASIERVFGYAAWADKWDGYVHHTPFRNVTLAMPEPIGVMAVVCPADLPLLGFVSTVVPPVALGNTVVAVPSEPHPLAATDLYQVFDTSDLPGGVINIVTGRRDDLAPVLAAHDDVDGIWYFGSRDGSTAIEKLSVGNMKRTWCDYGRSRDWFSPEQGEGPHFLREATQVKNIWVPYGE